MVCFCCSPTSRGASLEACRLLHACHAQLTAHQSSSQARRSLLWQGPEALIEQNPPTP